MCGSISLDPHVLLIDADICAVSLNLVICIVHRTGLYISGMLCVRLLPLIRAGLLLFLRDTGIRIRIDVPVIEAVRQLLTVEVAGLRADPDVAICSSVRPSVRCICPQKRIVKFDRIGGRIIVCLQKSTVCLDNIVQVPVLNDNRIAAVILRRGHNGARHREAALLVDDLFMVLAQCDLRDHLRAVVGEVNDRKVVIRILVYCVCILYFDLDRRLGLNFLPAADDLDVKIACE